MQAAKFTSRHIGPREEDQQAMMRSIGVASMEDLVAQTVPGLIRQRERMQLAPALSESQYLEHIDAIASKNVLLGITLVWGTTPQRCRV